MIKKLLSLLALGITLQSATSAPVEEGIDFDLDSAIDADNAHDLVKRVYGGKVPQHMFPFVAVIGIDLPEVDARAKLTGGSVDRIMQTYGNYTHPYCAGAVISQNWILTSANCMDKIQTGENSGASWVKSIKIYANRKYLRPTKREAWIDFKLKTRSAASIFIHPFYSSAAEGVNDIALLEVVPYTPQQKLIKKIHSKRYKFPRITKGGSSNDTWNNLYAAKFNNVTKDTTAATLFTGGWGLTETEMPEYGQYQDNYFLVRSAPSFKYIKTKAKTRASFLAANENNSGPLNQTQIVTHNEASAVEGFFGSSLCKWDTGAPLFEAGKWVNYRASYNSKLIGIFAKYYKSPGSVECKESWMVYTYLPAYCDWLRATTNEAIKCLEETSTKDL